MEVSGDAVMESRKEKKEKGQESKGEKRKKGDI